ncbi:alpha-glucuronidase [Myceligenerans salitolerans]|uniref:alpha-glucuronidase n=1 Tax=Myceligenerans salitolerans TaxID=1230528 RepID=UPI003558E1EE
MAIRGDGALVGTVAAEVATATATHGGSFTRLESGSGVFDADLVLTIAEDDADPQAPSSLAAAPHAASVDHTISGDHAISGRGNASTARNGVVATDGVVDGRDTTGEEDDESFRVSREDGAVVVEAACDRGLLYGFFHVVRLGEAAFSGPDLVERHAPATALRMLDHWDNVAVHEVMGQVERGYSGGSIFYDHGRVRTDLSRVEAYARLLASTGVNRVAINNVNVHAREARLLTDDLPHVARIAAAFRPWGIRVHLSVSFASPITLGGLGTSDPLDPAVARWWREAADRVWAEIPDFGGFVVKADSEGQPGPFAYGRDHADGANMLAEAVAPHGGLVHWRAFVYDHRQDWRDRSTDRARAAHDHFAPLDGRFAENVIVQVKYGPMDFQVREPVSPVIAAMPDTRVALELQVTQEYTGQQKHAVYLGRQWSEVLTFDFAGPDGDRAALPPTSVAGIVARSGGIVAVSNVGDDEFWTGHPLAQANLYAYGRLAWNPAADPTALLDEWIALTFPGAPADVVHTLHEVLDESWETYERYTSPLGVGFMVRPGHHYGPDVDGYEYTPWGTYHFADRDGIGVDRTVATGTGYAGLYPQPWASVYESLETCPDELLLFFHHVPYTHVLHSGKTVIQHIYDTHFDGVERVERFAAAWDGVAAALSDDGGHTGPGHAPRPGDTAHAGADTAGADDGRAGPGRTTPAGAGSGARLAARVSERLAEQLRSAIEWRDQVNTYFYRKSGIPDEQGRTIF